MNIGIVTTWFERGAGYVSKMYMDSLANEHNLFIYARGGESYAIGDPNWDGDYVYWSQRTPSCINTTVIYKKEFNNWIKKNKIDIIIFNEQTWWPPILWCKKLGVKTVAYIDYYTEATIPLFDAYDAVICNTKKHLEAFRDHHNVFYVPWGTNTNLFKPSTFELVNQGKVTFFHSCGMSPFRKGTDLFIRALEFFNNSRCKAIVHSQIDLKRALPHLKDNIDKYINEGLLEVVEGTVSAPGLYYKGDVYVYPSRLDGIGLTVAEAVSSGLALIVPNSGPMNEFVSDEFGKTMPVERFFSRADGYYWPQNEINVETLVHQMNYFLSKREDLYKIKQSARKYALKNLDWKKNSRALDIIFKNNYSILNSKKIPGAYSRIANFENRGTRRFYPFLLRLSWICKIYKFLFRKA